jgi:hypothetical protein
MHHGPVNGADRPAADVLRRPHRLGPPSHRAGPLVRLRRHPAAASHGGHARCGGPGGSRLTATPAAPVGCPPQPHAAPAHVPTAPPPSPPHRRGRHRRAPHLHLRHQLQARGGVAWRPRRTLRADRAARTQPSRNTSATSPAAPTPPRALPPAPRPQDRHHHAAQQPAGARLRRDGARHRGGRAATGV